MESTITAKGQITLSKSVRESMHLKAGDKVKIFVDERGRGHLLPVVPASALYGFLKTKKHATPKQLERAMAKGATARYRRFLAQ